MLKFEVGVGRIKVAGPSGPETQRHWRQQARDLESGGMQTGETWRKENLGAATDSNTTKTSQEKKRKQPGAG